MTKYNILIKVQSSTKELFKFYEENGKIYEADNLADLTTMYEKVLETYPKAEVVPMHALDVELNTAITE